MWNLIGQEVYSNQPKPKQIMNRQSRKKIITAEGSNAPKSTNNFGVFTPAADRPWGEFSGYNAKQIYRPIIRV